MVPTFLLVYCACVAASGMKTIRYAYVQLLLEMCDIVGLIYLAATFGSKPSEIGTVLIVMRLW